MEAARGRSGNVPGATDSAIASMSAEQIQAERHPAACSGLSSFCGPAVFSISDTSSCAGLALEASVAFEKRPLPSWSLKNGLEFARGPRASPRSGCKEIREAAAMNSPPAALVCTFMASLANFFTASESRSAREKRSGASQAIVPTRLRRDRATRALPSRIRALLACCE